MRDKRNFNPEVKVSEFRSEMGKNPLGDKPLVRKSGKRYIIEYYPDSIAGKRLAVWRKAKPHENHFRKWKKVAETEDFEGNLSKRFQNLTPQECRDMDN
jgi:hypothetical protein